MERTNCCPTPLELRALVVGELDAAREQDCTEHLDDCSTCQHAVELAAVGGEDLAQLVAKIDDAKPGSQSAYWSVVDGSRNLFAATMITPRPVEPESSAEPLAETRQFSKGQTPITPQKPLKNADEPIGVKLDFLESSNDSGSLGRLGAFEISRVVGRGGMGVVLEGFDTHLQRSVAIKVLDPQLQTNELARQRFCREARAAAAISHEHVVAVHQVAKAEDNAVPYLVMQLIRGESLEARLARNEPIAVNDILKLGMQTAAGLAAAHAQGLIHRDIKPGNILLEEGTERVKITDFGLARMTEDLKLTQSGFVTGTPMYMAPEQALGEAVDERADLFSLGAVLYEMAAGRPAFGASSVLAVLKKITEFTPPSLRELRPDLPEGAVVLIEHMLAKKPQDRPVSAQAIAESFAVMLATVGALSPLQVPALAEDVACEVVRAAMSESGQTACKHARRRARLRYVLIGTAVGVALSLLLALPLVLSLFGLSTNPTSAPSKDVTSTTSTPSIGPTAVLAGNSGPVWAVAFTPDGNTLAMAIDDGTVKLWDVASKHVLSTIKAHPGPVWGLSISHDGKLLATGGDDSKVRVFELNTGTELRAFETAYAIRTLAFAAASNDLLIGGRTGQVEYWNADAAERRFATTGHAGTVVGVATSPDGSMLASVSGDKTAILWSATNGAKQLSLEGHSGGVYGVAFSPDGTQVVTSGWDKTVRLWDTASGSLQHTCEGHGGDVWAVAFSPSTPFAASVGEDRIVRVWQTAKRSKVAELSSHTGSLYSASFSRDGQRLATAGRDGTARIWDMQLVEQARPQSE